MITRLCQNRILVATMASEKTFPSRDFFDEANDPALEEMVEKAEAEVEQSNRGLRLPVLTNERPVSPGVESNCTLTADSRTDVGVDKTSPFGKDEDSKQFSVLAVESLRSSEASEHIGESKAGAANFFLEGGMFLKRDSLVLTVALCSQQKTRIHRPTKHFPNVISSSKHKRTTTAT
jgi:hypothetical protein